MGLIQIHDKYEGKHYINIEYIVQLYNDDITQEVCVQLIDDTTIHTNESNIDALAERIFMYYN
jgi:hypothetical protein